MKFCEECGAKLQDTQKFCEECGAKVVQQTKPPEQPAPAPPPKPEPVVQAPPPQPPPPEEKPAPPPHVEKPAPPPEEKPAPPPVVAAPQVVETPSVQPAPPQAATPVSPPPPPQTAEQIPPQPRQAQEQLPPQPEPPASQASKPASSSKKTVVIVISVAAAVLVLAALAFAFRGGLPFHKKPAEKKQAKSEKQIFEDSKKDLDSVVADVCNPDKINVMNMDMNEYIFRASFEGGKDSFKDGIKSARDKAMAPEERIEFETCETGDVSRVDCADAYDEMARDRGLSVKKFKSAGEDMGITACGQTEVRIQKKGSYSTAIAKLYFGKTEDKWIMFGIKSLGEDKPKFVSGDGWTTKPRESASTAACYVDFLAPMAEKVFADLNQTGYRTIALVYENNLDSPSCEKDEIESTAGKYSIRSAIDFWLENDDVPASGMNSLLTYVKSRPEIQAIVLVTQADLTDKAHGLLRTKDELGMHGIRLYSIGPNTAYFSEQGMIYGIDDTTMLNPIGEAEAFEGAEGAAPAEGAAYPEAATATEEVPAEGEMAPPEEGAATAPEP